MYIDANKIIITFFLVRIKEPCGGALFLKPIKKNLEGKLVVTNGARFSYLTFFLLMILMQNFILANNYVTPQA